MDVGLITDDEAVVSFDEWELEFIVNATQWVLDTMGREQYGRTELRAVTALDLEEADEFLTRTRGLLPAVPSRLTALDVYVAHVFLSELLFRYLPLHVLKGGAEFARQWGISEIAARALHGELRALRATLKSPL